MFLSSAWWRFIQAETCRLFEFEGDAEKQELLKNPKKIEEIQKKKLLTEIEPLQLAF
jgi:hypothetical protein